MNRWMNFWIDGGWIFEWRDVWMNGRMVGWISIWMNGWMEG